MKLQVVDDNGVVMGQITVVDYIKESILCGDVQIVEFGGWDGQYFPVASIRKKMPVDDRLL